MVLRIIKPVQQDLRSLLSTLFFNIETCICVFIHFKQIQYIVARWLKLQDGASGSHSVLLSNLPAALRQKPAGCQETSASLYSSFRMKMAFSSHETAAAFLLIPLASAEPSKAATSGQLASPPVFFCGFSGSLASAALGLYCNLEQQRSVLESMRAAD